VTFAIGTHDTSAAWDVLIELLGAPSIYLSDGSTRTVSVNGTSRVWYSAAINISNVSESFTDCLMRGIKFGTVTLTLTDDASNYLLDWYQDNNYCIGHQVNLWLANVSDTTGALAFSGHVLDPRDSEYDDDAKELKLRVTDRRLYEDRDLPPLTIDRSDSGWKHCAPEFDGLPIPILYGDWTERALPTSYGEPVIKCIIKDNGCRRGNHGQEPMVLQICDPTPHGIAFIDSRVLIKFATPSNHSDLASVWVETSSASLTNGTFEIATSEYAKYDEGDEFYIYCQGNVDGSGNLIDNPVVMWLDLLDHYASPNVDVSTYVYNYSTAYAARQTCKARAFITDTVKLSDLLDQLCLEFNLLWGVRPVLVTTTWRPRYWIGVNDPWNEAAYYTVTADYDPANGSLSTQPVLIRDDQQKFYNVLIIKYAYNPRVKTWEKQRTIATSSDLKYHAYEVGTTLEELVIDSRFQYRICSGVFEFMDQQTYTRGTRPQLWEFEAWGWPIDPNNAYLGRLLEVQAENVTAFRGRIVDIERNIQTGRCKIRLLDFSDPYYFGRWQADGADNWTDSSTTIRLEYGFWTDADGNCDPLGTDSKHSNWVGC
jgi:hypothetical protein